MSLSIIIPTLNEAAQIIACLTPLQVLRSAGCEIILVDGGSQDATTDLAAPLVDKVLTIPRGRAVQMNAGAAKARGEILLFLHADTRLPLHADLLIEQGLLSSRRIWGRFDVSIEGRAFALRLVAWLMNFRSRLSGIATGDQAIFVKRKYFVAVGSFPNIELMEDIALSRRLKRLGRPLCLRQKLITSGRRWEQRGIWLTIFLMWRLRLAYFFGADPKRLARHYARPTDRPMSKSTTQISPY